MIDRLGPQCPLGVFRDPFIGLSPARPSKPAVATRLSLPSSHLLIALWSLPLSPADFSLQFTKDTSRITQSLSQLPAGSLPNPTSFAPLCPLASSERTKDPPPLRLCSFLTVICHLAIVSSTSAPASCVSDFPHFWSWTYSHHSSLPWNALDIQCSPKLAKRLLLPKRLWLISDWSALGTWPMLSFRDESCAA